MQVLEVMKTAFGKDPRSFAAFPDRSYPVGLLQLNAMRLADIFSDDSNFRSYMTHYFVSYNHLSLVWVYFSYPLHSNALLLFIYFSLLLYHHCASVFSNIWRS